MISTTTYRDTVTIHVTHPTDKDAVERTALAALRHGCSRVSIVVETRGKRGLICNLRPFAGAYFVSSERGSFDHPTIDAALATGLSRFAEIFDELHGWSKVRRENH